MKKVTLILIMALLSIAIRAQSITYQAVATCSRDMKTQEFSKPHASQTKITLQGKSAVTIDNKEYSVITVDRETRTDSAQSLQLTVGNGGSEYVIKITHDVNNKVELMRYQVIIFNTAHPYDWVYYFCTKPE